MKRFIIPLCCIGIVLLLHSVVRYHTISIFLAPAIIPLILAVALPIPAIIIALVAIIGEAFSSLPPGAMLLSFCVPFLTRYRAHSTPDPSWKFFGYVIGTTALQILLLAGSTAFQSTPSFSSFPLVSILLQIIATSIASFVVALLCYESRYH